MGGLLVFLGLVTFGLGVADLIYTEYFYGRTFSTTCRGTDYDWGSVGLSEAPCEYEMIFLSRIGAGIWAGFMVSWLQTFLYISKYEFRDLNSKK